MWRLSLWSDVECNSGSRLADIHPYASGGMSLAVNGEEAFTVQAPRQSPETSETFYWVDQIQALHVIRAENPTTSEVYEWRVSDISDVRTESGELSIQVSCDPILWDLRRAMVALTISGGSTFRNLGGINTSIQQYVDSYVLPAATAAGMSWWARGAIGNSDGVDIAWDGYTALELLRDLATEKGLEVRARRNGSTSYYIDVTTISSAGAKWDLDVDRSVRSLTRRQYIQGWANVLIPRGRVAGGAVDFADISDNRWEIYLVDTDGGGDFIAIYDPQTMLSPLVFDDQVNGLYVESETETTRQQITDSEVGLGVITSYSPSGFLFYDKLYLSDTSDFAEGDRVRIVTDSSGTGLTELENNESTATYPEVRGFYSRPDQRTEANYLRGTSFNGPRWSDHDDMYAIVATVDGTHSSTTTLNLKNLPQGLTISGGDLIGDTNGTWDATVASGSSDTVGVDGLAQVTLEASYSATDNDVIPICVGMAAVAGSPWPGLYYRDDNTEHHGIFIREVANYQGVYATGQYDGVHNGAATVPVKGFSASTLYPGPTWFSDDGSTFSGLWCVGGFKTDGSGEGDIQVNTSFGTFADGDPLGLYWPDLSGSPRTGRFVAVTSVCYQGAYINLTPFGVRFNPGRTTLYVGFGISHWGTGRAFTAAGTHLTPKVDIGVRALGSAGAYSTTASTAADYTTTTNEVFHVDHVGSVTLTQDSDVFVKFYPPRVPSTGTFDTVIPTTDAVFIRYISAWLGPDQEPPIVEGSFGNQLWYEANQQLDDVGDAPPISYTLTLADLTEVSGFDPSVEKLTLGQTMTVKDRDLGVENDVRIIGIDYDFADPTQTRVTLGRRPSRLSQLAVASRWSGFRPEYQQSNLTQVGAEVRPAVREEEAYRTNPTGGPTTGGSLTASKYTPPS